MSLPVFQATIVNNNGDIIPSAVITVLDEITGLGLTVYSNRAGTVPLGTNGVFTAGTDGFAQFFAPAGNYRVKAEQAASGLEKTWDFVPLVGGSAFDVDSYTEFGIGTDDTEASNITDLNSHNVSGFYYLSGATNKPSSSGNTGYLVVQPTANPLFTRQTWSELDNGGTWSRVNENGTWSAWTPVYTGANYQPESANGIGVVKLVRNDTGGSLSNGATALGQTLTHVIYRGGAFIGALLPTTGTVWENVSGVTALDGDIIPMKRNS